MTATPYDGDDLDEMVRAIYDGRGCSARSALRNIRIIRDMQEQCDAWMNGVADAVEPLGYDREAACGPADLLPGLKDLVPDGEAAIIRQHQERDDAD